MIGQAAALQLTSLIAHVRAGSVPLARRVTAPPRAAVAPAQAAPPAPASTARYVDIGANLLDDMFQGSYRGKQAHPPDLDAVLQRAAAAGVERIIVTAGRREPETRAISAAPRASGTGSLTLARRSQPRRVSRRARARALAPLGADPARHNGGRPPHTLPRIPARGGASGD
eukprot:4003268-Prymnesium_polylepis.2